MFTGEPEVRAQVDDSMSVTVCMVIVDRLASVKIVKHLDFK